AYPRCASERAREHPPRSFLVLLRLGESGTPLLLGKSPGRVPSLTRPPNQQESEHLGFQSVVSRHRHSRDRSTDDSLALGWNRMIAMRRIRFRRRMAANENIRATKTLVQGALSRLRARP